MYLEVSAFSDFPLISFCCNKQIYLSHKSPPPFPMSDSFMYELMKEQMAEVFLGEHETETCRHGLVD